MYKANVHPKSVTVNAGNTVYLTCYSAENVIVNFEGESLPDNAYVRRVSKDKHIIVIQKAKEHHSGKYQCYGESEYPSKKDERKFGDNIAIVHITSKVYYTLTLNFAVV